MRNNYTSLVYDLNNFGIFKITNAIVTSDMDDGISIVISFDGGKRFFKIKELNKKFFIPTPSNGKIQVKIFFEDIKTNDIYKIKTIGSLNLEIGTTIFFTRKSKINKTYSTNIGENGKYNISLPRGLYQVWYKNHSKEKVVLFEEFNPELFQNKNSFEELNKEIIIESFLKENDWAKYSIFDTFSDNSKMKHGSLFIDSERNLTDGITNRKMKYWAIGFD